MMEPENLILVHLRELRADMNARFDEMERRFETRFGQIDSRFEAINKCLEAMHANGMKALRSFIGHRTIFERTMGSVDSDIVDLKQRVEHLETARVNP